MGLFSSISKVFGKGEAVEEMSPMQAMSGHIQPALGILVGDIAEDPDNDNIFGDINFDEHMRISSVAKLLRNGNPVMFSPEAIAEANEVLSPMSALPENLRFTGFDFKYLHGAVETNMHYPD